MKKLITLTLIILGVIAVPISAQTPYPQDRTAIQRQDDRYRQNRQVRGNRGNQNRRYRRNYTYTVVNEQRYVRDNRGRVFRFIYRTTVDPYGRVVQRILVRRERVGRYDRYNDRDFRRETGNGFGIYFRIG